MTGSKEARKEEQGEILSGEEVLGEVFKKLKVRLFARELEFPPGQEIRTPQELEFPAGQKVRTEVYSYLVPNESHFEFMTYKSILLARIGPNTHLWAIGLGENLDIETGRCRYEKEIMALPVDPVDINKKSDDQLREELAERIRNEARLFQASLLVARTNGSLFVSERSSLYPYVPLALPEEAEEVIAGSVDGVYPMRIRQLSGEVKPIPQNYDPSIINSLEDAIVKTLFYGSSALLPEKGRAIFSA